MAAPTVDATQDIDSTGTQSFTAVTTTSTTDEYLVVLMTQDANSTRTYSYSDDVNSSGSPTYTVVGADNVVKACQLAYVKVDTTGSTTVTITQGGGSGRAYSARLLLVGGVDSIDHAANAEVATGVTSEPTYSPAVTISNDTLACVAIQRAGATVNLAGPALGTWTEVNPNGSDQTHAYGTITTGQSDTLSWTHDDSDDYRSAAIIFAGAAGGGGTESYYNNFLHAQIGAG